MLVAFGASSFGIDAGRMLRYAYNDEPDSLLAVLKPDSLLRASDTLDFGLAPMSREDSLRLARLDSIRVRRDSLYIDSLRAKIDSFGYDYVDSLELLKLDSLEKLYAEPRFDPRDTIVIPDSLEFRDPFKYKYYYAIKDTCTLRQTRDSLLSIPDSLELHRLDSLYFKDSSEVAHWRFTKWYQGLTKKERKKYDYDQALPGLIARQDSILARKDSIKAYKDSVKEATPRILETYIVPDSLQYKRILMWTHEPKTNAITLQKIDTTYNYYFHDYPFYREDVEVSYLGMAGSPEQHYNYFRRREEPNVIFYSPLQVYSYTPKTLEQYNTKVPFTELAYWGTLLSNSQKEESNIKILTTQNITPSLNIRLEYKRFGGKGLLQNEATDNRTAVVAANYTGKKYLMHAGYIYNKVGRSENGGTVDQDGDFNWIRDTTVKDVREINVRLRDASSLLKKHTLFLDHSYRVPFSALAGLKERKAEKRYKDSLMTYGDSLEIAEYLEYEAKYNAAQKAADTAYKDITSAYFGHSLELSAFKRTYTDNIAQSDAPAREFYKDYFYHPTKSADSLRVMKFENRLYVRLQPWKSDGIVSSIDAGVGDKLLMYHDFKPLSYLGASSKVTHNSLYAYAGVQGQYKKYLHWNADGQYTFAGHDVNDFEVGAAVDLNFYPWRRHSGSPLNITASFRTSLKEPDYYVQHLHTNHFCWDNDFKKTSTTKVEAGINIPRWRFSANVGYALLSNNTYFDTLGIARQNPKAMSVFSASIREEFVLWKFHLDNRLLLQFSSNPDVMPLPLLALNLRWYFQFNVVKNVMQMQIGANGLFTTAWHAPSYNPVLGVFYNQNEALYGNKPYIDVFVNVQWKRACIFLKVVNVNQGALGDKRDYFAANHYIKPVRTFKVGIYWPFYTQPSKNKGGNSSGGGGSRMGGASQGGGNAPMGGSSGMRSANGRQSARR